MKCIMKSTTALHVPLFILITTTISIIFHHNAASKSTIYVSAASSSIEFQKNFFLLPQKTMVTWINGIGFNMEHMTSGQKHLSTIFGNVPIHYCHNPTSMISEEDTFGYIGDLTQATTQKIGRISTMEVNELYHHLKHAILHVGKHGKVIHIAHSQGVLITSLAMKKFTRDEIRQMEVICFGGAEVLRSSVKYPFARCVNYYSVNDPLLFVVPSAAKALRSGVMGMGMGGMSFSLGNGGDDGDDDDHNHDSMDASLAAMSDPLSEPEFVFLTPRGGDPILDHGLFGPTYIDALKWEGRRYQSLYLPPLYSITRRSITSCHKMMMTIHTFLHHILTSIIRKFVWLWNIVNGWIHERIVVPIAITMAILWERIRIVIRVMKGEDVYVPVPEVIEFLEEDDDLKKKKKSK